MNATQSCEYTLMLGPATAATTVRTAQIDLSNTEYATIVVTAGAELNTNSTNVTLTVAHGDGTTYTTLSTATLDNTAATKQEFHVEPMGRGKYLKLTITPDSTTNGPVITTAHAIATKNSVGASGGTVL